MDVQRYDVVAARAVDQSIGADKQRDGIRRANEPAAALRWSDPHGRSPARDTWAFQTVGSGYRFVASDGGVFAFGAPFHGSTGNLHLNQPIVGMAADPGTGGYWLVAKDGGIFTFDAPYFGSAGNVPLAQPIVGIAAAPNGKGYWLVGADGSIFNYGSGAPRDGAPNGPLQLNHPIVGIAADPTTHGYRLVASDGGIFTFGAPFHGSTGNIHLNQPIVGIASDPGDRRLLARRTRRRRVRVRRTVLRFDRQPASQPTDRRYHRRTRRPGLLARRQRRRHLQLRPRRHLPRLHRQPPPQPTHRRDDRLLASGASTDVAVFDENFAP